MNFVLAGHDKNDSDRSRRSALPSDIQRIQLEVRLTPDDYVKYFAVAGQRQSTWTNTAIYAGAFFMAIPAALAAKALAGLNTEDPIAIELVGRFSLLAFFAGLITLILAFWIVRRLAVAGALTAVPNAYDAKTVVLDQGGISITGKLSQASWTWPAITRMTTERGLVLFWIGSQSAAIIPDRAFSNSTARDELIAFSRARIAEAQSGRL